MIKVQIDVKKIDKSRIFEGRKGKYLNLLLIETPNSQYGDYMVVHERTEQERASGQKLELPILGNAKIIGKAGHAKSEAKDDDDW